MVNDYLLNCKLRKIGSCYSTWEEILVDVSQGSVLEPLLLKIFLCDLYVILENNYQFSRLHHPICVWQEFGGVYLFELSKIVGKLIAIK